MLFQRNKASTNQADTQQPLVAIDIGTCKVRLIAGTVNEKGEVLVSYYNEKDSQGMVNGSVSDLHALSEVLSQLVQNYEQEMNTTFRHCIVGIAGKHIESRNEVGEATVPSHTITENDRKNALQHARSIKIADYKHLIHVIPQAYMTDVMRDNYDSDKSAYIINPVGMSAMRLSVGVHLIACDEDQENNLRSAVESLSPDAVVDQVIFNGVAAADAVLTPAEKDIGVCLIDFGGGTVNVAVYNDGKLILTFGLGLGGDSITKEIATRFGVPLSLSNVVKCNYGVAHSSFLNPDDQTLISISTTGTEESVVVTRQELATAICYKLSDIFAMITNRIDNYSRSIKEPIALGAGFVLTGGVAQTQGMAILATRKLLAKDNMTISSKPRKARVGLPRGVVGDYEVLNTPACATAIGLLRLGHTIQEEENHEQLRAAEIRRKSGSVAKMWHNLKDWLSQEL